MRFRLLEMLNEQAILAGAGLGRRALGAMIECLGSEEAPTPAFLDFEGIEIATSSFLREAVIGFRDYVRASRPIVYPVVANAAAQVTEELEFFVRARGDVVWSCKLDAAGTASGARLIGELDPAQQEAFTAIREMGTASAPDLAARFADPQSGKAIGATAWNNRLSALAGKGLIVERKQGKSKTFQLLLEVE